MNRLIFSLLALSTNLLAADCPEVTGIWAGLCGDQPAIFDVEQKGCDSLTVNGAKYPIGSFATETYPGKSMTTFARWTNNNRAFQLHVDWSMVEMGSGSRMGKTTLEFLNNNEAKYNSWFASSEYKAEGAIAIVSVACDLRRQ